MDVTHTTRLSDIIDYANEYHTGYQYKKIVLKDYYINLNLNVETNKILDPEMSLISLYSDGIVKEVLFLVV